MAILKVARLGHPVLRVVGETVPREEIRDPAFQRLIDDMFETMDEYAGIGLAAPQVHQSIQLLVTGEITDPDDDDQYIIQRSVLINPELTFLTDEEIAFYEGCLSIPDFRGRVPRIRKVRLTGLDRKGKTIDQTIEGFGAVVYQHEIDHLNGVVFLDRMRDFSSLGYIRELERYAADEPVA